MSEQDVGLMALAEAIEVAAIAEYAARDDERKRVARELEMRALQEITRLLPMLRRASLQWVSRVIAEVYIEDAPL